MPIHWLFAGDTDNRAVNGFVLTGGIFTRQSDSTFLDENGNVVGSLFIKQNFTGFTDNTKELYFDTYIEAKLPQLVNEEQVIYPDFTQQFNFRENEENPVENKIVESSGSIHYMIMSIRNTNLQKKFRIEYNEKIHFTVCPSYLSTVLATASAQIKLTTSRLFVTYSNSEDQVRFSSTNGIRAQSDPRPNPCENNGCSLFAECIVDEDEEDDSQYDNNGGRNYYCQCKPGFDGDGITCYDMNECAEGITHCSPNANCVNFLGHYECLCLAPHIGDGRVCELPEADNNSYDVCSQCHVNARCVADRTGTPICQCNSGYIGNGFECQLDYYNPNNQQNTYPPVVVAETTRQPTLPPTTSNSNRF
jgi:hypothetical protein